MNEFLNHVILDNEVRVYLVVAGIILLVILFKRYVSKYLAGLLFRVVQRIVQGVDKTPFVNLVVVPMETFLVILVTMIALEKLTYPKVFDFTVYRIHFHSILESASIIILLIAFIWLLLRIIDFIAMILEQKANLTPEQTDNQLIVFFKDFFKVVLVIIGILMILKFAFAFQIGSLLTGLSIATAAIALATRESLENLIASFIIFFDKPFSVGDLVKVQQITGTVEKIGLRSTRLRTTEKTWVTVPNKQMVDSMLDNQTLRTHRRGFLSLELRAQTSHDDVNQFIAGTEKLLRQRSEVQEFTVFLTDIHKDALIVQVEFLVASVSANEFSRMRQEITLSIIKLMEEKNIRLASKEQN
ncbi:MAG TPA: mechanosensitive ion channel domain-containing protein [Chitinophagaceae bacterium]|nr:mechanosensitive ion channel domain-containing protein [Chitinophagaceae bacterium]